MYDAVSLCQFFSLALFCGPRYRRIRYILVDKINLEAFPVCYGPSKQIKAQLETDTYKRTPKLWIIRRMKLYFETKEILKMYSIICGSH